MYFKDYRMPWRALGLSTLGKDSWRNLMNTALDITVSQNAGNFLPRSGIIIIIIIMLSYHLNKLLLLS